MSNANFCQILQTSNLKSTVGNALIRTDPMLCYAYAYAMLMLMLMLALRLFFPAIAAAPAPVADFAVVDIVVGNC